MFKDQRRHGRHETFRGSLHEERPQDDQTTLHHLRLAAAVLSERQRPEAGSHNFARGIRSAATGEGRKGRSRASTVLSGP